MAVDSYARFPHEDGQPAGDGRSREDGLRLTGQVTKGLVGVSAAAVLGFGILAHEHSSATPSAATSGGTGTATSDDGATSGGASTSGDSATSGGTSTNGGTSTSQGGGSVSGGGGLVFSGGGGGGVHGQTGGS